MSVEGSKSVARRVLDDLVTQGRYDVVDEIYAPSFEFCDPAAGQTITTHDGIKDLTREIRARTPDITVTIEEEIAEGEAVVHRWIARGHHASTGKSVATPGISIYHIQDERIVSEYVIPARLVASTGDRLQSPGA